MTSRRLHGLLLRIATITSVLLASGCFLGPGQTDEGSDIVSQLQIEIPASATDITSNMDSGVEFLMPNSEWREYVTKYYANKALTPFPASKETDGSVPLVCVPAFRSGVELEKWVTGDDIRYRNTDDIVHRTIIVTPDCAPGKAHVQWVLGDRK